MGYFMLGEMDLAIISFTYSGVKRTLFASASFSKANCFILAAVSPSNLNCWLCNSDTLRKKKVEKKNKEEKKKSEKMNKEVNENSNWCCRKTIIIDHAVSTQSIL